MNWNKPATNKVAKQPTVRKTIVQVPVVESAVNGAKARAPAPGAPPARPRDTNRYKLSQTPASKVPAARHPPKTVERRALAPSRGVKRKCTPEVAFSDEELDDSSDIGASDSDASRKRMKSSVSSVGSLSGPRRKLVSDQVFRQDGEALRFIHGTDATSGEHAAKFVNPWDDESFAIIKLQYPSRSQRERFELKWPKNDKDDYKPMEDILTTIETVATFYLPDELSVKYMDDAGGFTRRFNRAWQRQSIPEWLSIVEDYNAVLKPLVEDGTVQRELGKRTSVQLDWIKRILDQTFWRTVSPRVEILNAYKNGSDNVYGELLPRFASDIFKETGLNHEQVFIDLGSGVGNVVLQAALEVGCESWGIEMMKNPCDLAELQAQEFEARTQLWGLNVGSVKLLRGDMTAHPEVSPILQRADVVLVNNQAFTPGLNVKLLSIFLDLKPGAKVVSLKPFVPEGHKIAARNIDSIVNQFVQRRLEYFSGCVSWSDLGNGSWYIATKDLRPLNAFRRRMGLDKV